MTRGLYGVEEAQPLAYVLTFLPAMCFAYWMLNKKMPAEDSRHQ